MSSRLPRAKSSTGLRQGESSRAPASTSKKETPSLTHSRKASAPVPVARVRTTSCQNNRITRPQSSYSNVKPAVEQIAVEKPPPTIRAKLSFPALRKQASKLALKPAIPAQSTRPPTTLANVANTSSVLSSAAVKNPTLRPSRSLTTMKPGSRVPPPNSKPVKETKPQASVRLRTQSASANALGATKRLNIPPQKAAQPPPTKPARSVFSDSPNTNSSPDSPPRKSNTRPPPLRGIHLRVPHRQSPAAQLNPARVTVNNTESPTPKRSPSSARSSGHVRTPHLLSTRTPRRYPETPALSTYLQNRSPLATLDLADSSDLDLTPPRHVPPTTSSSPDEANQLREERDALAAELDVLRAERDRLTATSEITAQQAADASQSAHLAKTQLRSALWDRVISECNDALDDISATRSMISAFRMT